MPSCDYVLAVDMQGRGRSLRRSQTTAKAHGLLAHDADVLMFTEMKSKKII